MGNKSIYTRSDINMPLRIRSVDVSSCPKILKEVMPTPTVHTSCRRFFKQ